MNSREGIGCVYFLDSRSANGSLVLDILGINRRWATTYMTQVYTQRAPLSVPISVSEFMPRRYLAYRRLFNHGPDGGIGRRASFRC